MIYQNIFKELKWQEINKLYKSLREIATNNIENIPNEFSGIKHRKSTETIDKYMIMISLDFQY